ncbi:MAG: hypothetical protein RR891_06670 [Clostridium sp.]|uniref:hypothetical protein n=1 Tax=Clostridium sp. TaxID=1506 RepID=UPI0030635A60
MRKTMVRVITWSILISSVAIVCFFNYMEQKGSGPYIQAMADNNQVVNNKLIEHISLAEEAINEFGADSDKEAVELWAKGIMTRNGVLQYAVMDNELKAEFKEKLKDDENISWVTGVSSPWVTGYEINDVVNVSDKLKLYRVKFNLATSNGAEGPVYNTVTVVNREKKWVLSSIR